MFHAFHYPRLSGVRDGWSSADDGPTIKRHLAHAHTYSRIPYLGHRPTIPMLAQYFIPLGLEQRAMGFFFSLLYFIFSFF